MKKVIITILTTAALGAGFLLLTAADDTVARDTVNEATQLSDLVDPDPNPELGPPDLSREKVLEVLAKLKQIQRNGGMAKIARDTGCSYLQVRLIQRERLRRIRELSQAP